jgi:hypothetical protein
MPPAYVQVVFFFFPLSDWNTQDRSHAMVRVEIVDVNDNPPAFLDRNVTIGETVTSSYLCLGPRIGRYQSFS